MRAVGLIAVCAASMASSVAEARGNACVTKEDAVVLMLGLAPDAVEALAERCAPVLPPDSFLATSAASLADRYRASSPSPERVGAIFERMTGQATPSDAAAEAILVVAGEMVKAEVVKLKQEDCPPANDIVEALAPLPAENLSQLIGSILLLSQKDGKQAGEDDEEKTSFRICNA